MEPQRTVSRHLVPRDLRVTAAVLVTLVVLGGLVGQTIHPAGAPGWSFPTESGAAAASPTTEPWTALQLPPYEPLAELTPDRSDASGLARDAIFTLRSTTATPAAALAAGLVAVPSVVFQVTAGPTADVATLRPTSPLDPGTRYRFRLSAPDGSLAGSWSFRVAGPLHAVGLLPADRTTSVPVDTGIEVTFDQDDPVDFAPHFSISPKVDGRFEVHDRTWVFVPTSPLDPATVYTYTVSPGVAMASSDQVLEAEVRASFETAATDINDPTVTFDRTVFEIRTGTRPLLGISVSIGDDEEAPPLESLPTEIYRLPTLASAAAAAATLAQRSEWIHASSMALVSTENLVRVASFDGRLTDPVEWWYVLHVPVVLDPGWYLVVIPRDGRDAQAIIEVTDLATYAMSSTTRTVVWLNDLATGSPVADAAIAVAGGAVIGRTDANGLLDAPTPGALLTGFGDDWNSPPHVVTVRTPDGRGALAILGMRSEGHYPWSLSWADPTRHAWWSVFDTDRSTYRTTDTIHAWGFVRARADRSVPEQVTLDIVLAGDEDGPPVVSVSATPTARGTFVADVPIRDLPRRSYELMVSVGGERLSSQWLEVSEIRKPALSIDVKTNHRAYLAGDPIEVSATARFFDGTTTPDLRLSIGTWDWENDRIGDSQTATTDATGVATASLTASSDGPDGWGTLSATVVPTNPEEGDTRSEAELMIFPSSLWIRADMAIRDGRLRISGRTTAIDIEAVDQQLADSPWLDDPAGPAAAGQKVTAEVIEFVPVKTLVGTAYDYLEKRVIQIYDYDTREKPVGTYTVESGQKGRFSLSIAVPNLRHGYKVVLRTRDAAGRMIRRTVETWQNLWQPTIASLVLDGTSEVSIGDPVELTAQRPDGTVPDGRYLFLVGRDGIQDVILSEDGTFRQTLRDRDLPGYLVEGVRLSDQGLETAGTRSVSVKLADRELVVSLAPDRERYQPGDTATVAIRTTGTNGEPVAADVVVRGTDQKLYAMGLAWDPQTIDELMAGVGSGFLQSFLPAYAPRPFLDYGGGAGSGGGGRDNFQDALTFQLVRTDAQGRGTVSFDLPDDLTSWHVAAAAFTGTLMAGDGTATLPVGLPFFVEATLAPSYLVGERPVLRLRAYGEGLRADDPVRFAVTAPSLGLGRTVIEGRAFEAVRVPLPVLTAGDHRVAIDGERIGSINLADSLVRTVHVIPNRLTALRATFEELTGPAAPQVGVDVTTYLVTDAGRGSLVPLLQELAQPYGARFDRLAAAEAARAFLASEFNVSVDDLTATGFDPERYQVGGEIALLPYATADLSLGAEAALVTPDSINKPEFLEALHWRLASRTDPDADPQERPTREQVLIIGTALAALGEDVLEELRAAAASEPPLTLRERLWLGLGYLASGDEAAARTIERDLLTSNGRVLGPWVRLEAGARTDEASGLMLLLASGLGDPVATSISRYVADHPSAEQPFVLEQLGYAKGMLDRLPRAAGSFVWTVNGQRHLVTLDPGESFTLSLTPAQQQTLEFERVAGALVLTTTAVVRATPADLPSDPAVTITRTVSPANDAPDDRLVHVTLTVTFHDAPGPGCWTVTDLVPSGLAPIARVAGWPDESSGPRGWEPFLVDGQRVAWCIDPLHNKPLVYTARVVSPGTYSWEPAVVQFDVDPSIGAATPTTSYTIR